MPFRIFNDPRDYGGPFTVTVPYIPKLEAGVVKQVNPGSLSFLRAGKSGMTEEGREPAPASMTI